jgi:transposase-like protein
MRYPGSEKLEIVRIVEQSHLSARQTLDQLGIARRTFYRWYDRYLGGGPEALEDRPSAPSRVWNRIPAGIHDQIIELALEQSELSPRELAVRFTDEQRYFVSEATVYRLLKAHDLITSDNGPSYIAGELAEYIEARKMSHVRGAPMHPQTQGKIERWHQTLKNRILLENYFLPGDLEIQIEAFVEHYNHQRYHESLNNVTPADAYFGRASAIIERRERIKRQTIEHRRLQHRKLAA